MKRNRLQNILLLSTVGLVLTSGIAHADDAGSRFYDLIKPLLAKVQKPAKDIFAEQDQAVQLARSGQPDAALEILEPIYKSNTNNLSIARDYAAILRWAGRDVEAISIYEGIPAHEPDYVLAAIGHSYRKLNQTDKALEVYRLGGRDYPTNVTFTEGEIRCLVDKEDFDTALARTNEDIAKHGERPEIIAARKDINELLIKRRHDNAINLARTGQYQQALSVLTELHAQYPNDIATTRDFMAVTAWAGGHDDSVVAIYESMGSTDQPDYVLSAAAGSYRRLNKTDKALATYQEGLRRYLDNVTFVEGIIRCLLDANKYNDAILIANEDIRIHGSRPEITSALQDAQNLKSKNEKHTHKTKSAKKHRKD